MQISELVEAINTLNTPDAFRAGFSIVQWETIANYMIPFELKGDELLIAQGETDRVCYFVASGSLQVYVTGGVPGGTKLAIVRAGTLLGEPSLFGEGERMANVRSLTPCTLWALSAQRFEQMAQRVPPIALDFLRAAGVVMAARMRAAIARQAPYI